MSGKNVICFGEVLWDLLPGAKVAGGAPMNVAYHLNNFGVKASMVSRVGTDDLGRELLNFLQKKGVNTHLIQQDERIPTGIVNIVLDPNGSPSYEIVQPAAWDFIQLNEQLLAAAAQSDVLVFGSLATRHATSRNTLLQLLDRAKMKVFDVNLRPPFYRQEALEKLLEKANIVKMNDEELDIISAWYGSEKDEYQKLEAVKSRFDLTAVLLTKGKDGALYLDDQGSYEQPGFPVKVKDTIGSGDSFLAAFLAYLLAGRPPQTCLEFACLTGALVATYPGGTPAITEQEVLAFAGKTNKPS